MMVLLGLALASQAGGRTCTLMGYFDSVYVAFDGDLSRGGSYEVTLKEGPRTVGLCAFEVPITSDQDLTCGSSMAIDPTSDGTVRGVGMFWVPEDLRIAITRDEEVLVDDVVNLEYTEDEPNGKGCGVRTTGEGTLSW